MPVLYSNTGTSTPIHSALIGKENVLLNIWYTENWQFQFYDLHSSFTHGFFKNAASVKWQE